MCIRFFLDLNIKFNTHTHTMLSTIDFELDTHALRLFAEFVLQQI